MEIKSFTYIEIENNDSIWAVNLEDAKDLKHPVKSVKPLFIEVANQIGDNFIVIDNTLLKSKPSKIIDGVNGDISDDYIEVGVWNITYKSA